MPMQVLIVLEYDQIDDAEGFEADVVVDSLTEYCERLKQETGATAAWVEEVFQSTLGENDDA